MTTLSYRLVSAQVLTPRGLDQCALSVVNGILLSCSDLPVYDLSGYIFLPRIVDLHGDGFERYLSPRRGR